MNKPSKLIGKTISDIDISMYYETVTLSFTDGSELVMKAYISSIHNDRWPAISVGEVKKA